MIKYINHTHTPDCYAHGCIKEIKMTENTSNAVLEKMATPVTELEYQICSTTIAKNEREWWAHREIESLRENNASLSARNLALRRACRMAVEALEMVTEAEEKEAEYWTVNGGSVEAVHCVAAINAINAQINGILHSEINMDA